MLTHGIRRGLIAVALGAMSLLGAACATSAPKFVPPTPDPVAEQRVEQISPFANLDVNGLAYVGQLPETLAPLTPQTDALGDITYVDTASAVARFGERRVREHVVKNVRLCARVEIQKHRLNFLRRYGDSVEQYNADTTAHRRQLEALPYAGYVAGAASAWSSFGQDYGVTYILGNLIPGVTNQAIYGQVLDRSDVQAGYQLAQGRYFESQNDFWLDSMGEWCPAFIDWVAANGQIVRVGGPATAGTTGPPASSAPANW